MKYRLLFASIGLLCSFWGIAQDSSQLKLLEDIVVTGQYKPQSLKKSVYQVKVINSERIKLSGSNNVQQILSNQIGFRFSADNTIGTTDVQLMGMAGRNVKILLDGVPMIDRGDTRESLNQIDVNTIERIEIVEGPMSVSYGSDALAGVINIITKKAVKNSLSITAKIQEETAGKEYHALNYQGVHTQHIGVSYKKNNWLLSTGGTHIDFSGFGGDEYGRAKTWKPKEQWLGNIKLGYTKNAFTIYYRLDALNEKIISKGAINYTNYKAIDQQYITDRFTHQIQSGYSFNSKTQLSVLVGYTDYKRKTKTTRHDFEKNTNELTTGDGEQDISSFKSVVFRTTLQYELNDKIVLQPGIDINREQANGVRILNNPVIEDYAAFVSAEIKPTTKIFIRPGVRFIKNSVYNAPPVIPSINTKFILSNTIDVKAAYAYGFRSPALRELYFNFVDANHNIVGNPNLKAENSNSFNASINYTASPKSKYKYTASLSSFYNEFNNQIDFALASSSSNQYTYFNVNKAKTIGIMVDNKITYKNIEASVGIGYIAYNGKLYDEKNYIKESDKDFLWTPEVSTNISYSANSIKTKFNLFYKYVGKKQQFVTGKNASNKEVLLITEANNYNLADFTTYTTLNKFISISAGAKNLFNITDVNRSVVNSSSIHNTGNSIAIGYGRSYFLGLVFNWNN